MKQPMYRRFFDCLPVKVSTSASAGISLLMPLVISSSATAAEPAWWVNRGVIDTQATSNNNGVANIGQLKHMAEQAKAEMDDVLPGGAGFILPFPTSPSNPDLAWYDQQKKVLNIGQLKSVAQPIYDRLNAIDANWVQSQMTQNGLTPGGGSYPWDLATPVEENYKAANIGQLKLVFSLRLSQSTDGDSIPDLIESAMYGDSTGDGTTTDFDGDGLTDAQEMLYGTSMFEADTDHDGVSDGDEVTASSDPLVANSVTTSATALDVWTVLE